MGRARKRGRSCNFLRYGGGLDQAGCYLKVGAANGSKWGPCRDTKGLKSGVSAFRQSLSFAQPFE